MKGEAIMKHCKFKTLVCPTCEGCGYRESRNGYWAAIEAHPCDECLGEGTIQVDEEDERPAFRDEYPDCIWRGAATPFAENH